MDQLDKERCGVLIGSGVGGMMVFSDDEAFTVLYRKMNPFCVQFPTTNRGSAMLSIDFVSDGYVPLFGRSNLVQSNDSIKLLLNRYTGSGFISSATYKHGLFSASIKLPSNYSAGIVVAFYASNHNVYENNHDEIDFEFLGNIVGEKWTVQTNVYGNGSTRRGREERYTLPFDPTHDFHRYSILWTYDEIIFYVDDIPIRYVKRTPEMGGDYPSKPMSVYATIWDGSTWATYGGKYGADYKYEPFEAEFKDFVLVEYKVETSEKVRSYVQLSSMTEEKRRKMEKFREMYMSYSACYDRSRYQGVLPGCNIVGTELVLFKENGKLRS